MKKWSKILSLVAVISFMLAGAIVMGEGGSEFFVGWGDGQMNINPAQDVAKINQLSLDGSERQIQINGAQESVVVQMAQGGEKELKVEQVAGTALENLPVVDVIKEGEHVVVQVAETSNALVNLAKVKLFVTVPASYEGQIDVQTQTGDIEINSTYAKKIKASSQKGSIKALAISSNKEWFLDSELGDVTVTLLKLKDFELQLETKKGVISLPATPEVSMTSDTKTVKFKKGTGEARFNIDTEMGDVTIK